MIFIFTADTHFDSAFIGENADIRNGELLTCFKNIVLHAEKIGAKAVVLGGDLFDTPYPSPETKAALKNIIEAHPNIMFLGICGNHDPLYKTTFYDSLPENFYVFPDTITRFDIQDVTFYGVSEKNDDYEQDKWQGFHAEGKFITLSHGNLHPSSLADTGASLCLLGHIHKTEVHTLPSGTKALYCGTPAGRGFDECGEKGFYVIDSEDFSFEFVRSDAKIYKEYEVDISNVSDTLEIIDLLEKISQGPNEIARVKLCGNVSRPFLIDTKRLCGLMPQFTNIKDCSGIDIDVMQNINENTLEGEFIRILSQKLEKARGENKQKILDAMKEGVIALRRKQ